MDSLRISAFGRMAAHEVAVKEGLYAAAGLDVELHVTQSSKAQMKDLLDDVRQLVHTNADNVVWWDEDNGADFVIIMAAPSRPGQSLVVRPEITSITDLRGRVLAVDAAESGYATPLRLLLQRGGLSAEGRDYHFVEVGSTEHRVAALRDGRAFGAMIGDAAARELQAEGFPILDTINRLYTHYAGSAAVRRSWVERHPDVLQRYLGAHLCALSASGQKEAPPFSWEGLTEILQTRKDVGLLRGPVDPHRFASDTYYRAAVASL